MSEANLIPKIQGFQPIPNAVMIPFMETQSAALAFGFGLNYEYGKRTIRSMSNETFNSLTSEKIAEMSAQHSTVLLDRFIQAVPQVMPAQTEIFKQYVEIEKAKVLQNVELAKWLAQNVPQIIFEGTASDSNIGTSGPTTVQTPTSGGTSIVQDETGTVTTTRTKETIVHINFRYPRHVIGTNGPVLSGNYTYDATNDFHFFHRKAEALRAEIKFLGTSTNQFNQLKVADDLSLLLGLQQNVNPIYQAFV